MIPPIPSMQAPPAQQEAAAAVAAVAASRAKLLALALQAGQALEAKVLGLAPSGMTRIAIAGQTLTVSLPVPPPVGTVMQAQLRLDPEGRQPVLVLHNPAAAPPAPAQPPIPVQPAAVPPPAPAPAHPASPPVPASTTTPAPTPVAAAPAAGRPIPGAAQVLAPTSLPPPAATASMPAPGPQAAVPPSPVAPAVASQPALSVAAGPAVAAAPPGSAPPVVASASPSLPQAPPAAIGVTQPPAAAPLTAPSTVASPPTTPASSPGQVPASIATAPAPAGNAAPANPAASSAPAPPPVAALATLTSRPAVSAPPLPLATGNASRPMPPVQPSAPPPATGSAAGIALGQSAQAAARQDSIAPLLQNLAALQNRMAKFPRPVAEAALRVLAGRLVLSGGAPDAAQLKQAVLRSGVLLNAPAPASAATADLRTGLLQLRSALLGFLGSEIAAVAPVARRPPPPTRDAQLRGLRAEPPTLPEAATPRDAGRTLLHQTDAALSRMRLLQLASLSQEAGRAGAPAAAADWTLEVPMLLGNELAVAQLRIAGDGRNGDRKRARNWRLQFSVHFSVLGEVGAQIGFSDRRAGIALWAEEPATASALETMLPELDAALAARGIEVASLRVGRRAPETHRPRAGQLLDGMR